jgi:hypothetical protein
MTWQKTVTLATTADVSAMLLSFSGFGRFHYTIELEEDMFQDLFNNNWC